MPILRMRCQGNVVEAKGEYCGECKADFATAVCAPSDEVDLAEVVALSNHLGGSTLAPRAFVHEFGRITSENHFGARVVDGLVRFVDATYWPEIR